MEYFRQFLKSPGVRGERPPELHLSIFGKHPGWDDHIPDHKLVTDTLAMLKSVLYVRGIGGVIDSGVWENLSPDHFVPDFNHVFVAQRRGEWIYGRMWASSDGKGRARYPMCVVVHGIGTPLDRALPRLSSAIDAFRDRCMSYPTADEVFAQVDETELELQGLTRDFISGGDNFIPSRRPLEHLTQFTLADAEQHRRLLYEISNQLVPFAPGRANLALLDEHESGEHLRVPVGDFSPPDESLLAWITYLRTQIDGAVPIMLFRPVEYDWVDVIIGVPNASNLACLKSDLPRTPMITAIEFNLPEGFPERADTVIEKIGSWENDPAEGSILGAPPKDKLGRRLAKAAGNVTRPPFPISEPSTKTGAEKSLLAQLEERVPAFRLIGIIVGGVLLLLILIVLIFGGGNDGGEEASVSDEAAKTSALVAERTVPAPEVSSLAGAWDYLESASAWYPRFLRLARAPTVQEQWREYPDIVGFLDWIGTREFIDHREAVGQRSTIDAVGLAALRPDQREKLLKLAADVQEMERRIRGWTILQMADSLRGISKANRWLGVTTALDRDFPPLVFDRDLGKSLSARVEKSSSLRSAAAGWDAYTAQRDRLLAMDAAPISEFVKAKQELLKGVSSLGDLESRLARLQVALDRVEVALSRGSESVDFAALEKDPRYTAGTSMERADQLPVLLGEYQRLIDSPSSRFDLESAYPESEYTEQLKTLGELDPAVDLAPFRSRREELGVSARDFARIPRLAQNADEIEREGNALRKATRELRNDLSTAVAAASRPTEWYSGLALVELNAPRLNEAWKTRFASLVSPTDLPALEGDIEAYRARRRLVGMWLEGYQVADGWMLSAPWKVRLGEADAGIQAVFGEVLTDHFTARSIEFLDTIASGQMLSETSPAEALREWQGSALEGARDIYQLATDLSVFAWALGLSGPIVAPPNLEARLLQQWSAESLPPEISILRHAATDLSEVEAENDPVLLLGFLSTQEHRALRAAAWRRLQELEDWPGNARELQQALGFARRSDLGEPLQQEVRGRLPDLWRQALSAADGRVARNPVWAMREDAGVALEDLSAHERFEWVIVEALNREFALADAEAARGIADQTLKTLSSLPKSLLKEPEVAAFMTGLEKLDLSGAGIIESNQLAGIGPAEAGWKMMGTGPDGTWVRYEWPSENLRGDENRDAYALVFRLVEQDDGERFYLSCDEVSAGLFFDWLNEQGLWSEVRGFFPDQAFGSEDPSIDLEWRSGARTWELSKSGEYQPPFDWQLQTNTTGIPLNPALQIARPSRFTPITHISASAVSEWSELLGCRLPTVVEWITAAKSGASPLGSANLRDRTWELQQNYLLSEEVSGFLGQSWPDVEIFLPAASSAPSRANAARASENEDGFIWFHPIPPDPGSDDSFRDMRGNVAEWLIDANGAYAVGGASALSPKEVIWDSPVEAQNGDTRGFADVGCRLAFDAPTPLPGRVLHAALAAAPDFASSAR